jgi:hypothetical protein
MFNEQYSIGTKKAISFVLFDNAGGRMIWSAVYFKNAPFPFITDEKVCLSVLALFQTKVSFTVWEEKNFPTVKFLCNSDLGLRAKTEALPNYDSSDLSAS